MGHRLPELRGYFDGLVADLMSPAGRKGCLMVTSATELAAEDSEVARVVSGHMA
jgi:TetR/AcrR family transcriptional repressor of nem operon